MAELSNEKRLRLAGLAQEVSNGENNEVRKKAFEAMANFMIGKHSVSNAICPSVEDMEEAGVNSIEKVPQPKQGYTTGATQNK